METHSQKKKRSPCIILEYPEKCIQKETTRNTLLKNHFLLFTSFFCYIYSFHLSSSVTDCSNIERNLTHKKRSMKSHFCQVVFFRICCHRHHLRSKHKFILIAHSFDIFPLFHSILRRSSSCLALDISKNENIHMATAGELNTFVVTKQTKERATQKKSS